MHVHKPVLTFATVCCCVLVGWLVWACVPALASRGYAFSSSLVAPGGFSEPVGVSVDNSSGLSKDSVYVAARGNSVLDKFSPAGVWQASVGVPGAGFRELAVQEAGLTAGNVYAVGFNSGVVYQFSSGLVLQKEIKGLSEPAGVAVDEAGDVFVAEYAGNPGNGRVLEFNAAGEPINAAGVVDYVNSVVEGLSEPQSLAISANGEQLYVATASGTFEYTISGSSYSRNMTIDAAGSTGVSLTGSGAVLVDGGGEAEEYESSGVLLARFGTGVLTEAYGIAANSETHNVYVADSSANKLDLFEEGSTPEQPKTLAASEVKGSTAILNGQLVGGGAGTSDYYFQYNASGSCGDGTTTVSTAGSSGAVHDQLVGLQPHTVYTFCLVATNKYGLTVGAPLSFETEAVAPAVEEESFANVGSNGATVAATVNPGGSMSNYWFEYGATTSYGSTTTLQSLGLGSVGVAVSAELSGLRPETTYHFRVVATNVAGETAQGSDTVFETFSSSSSELPDGRVYEVVTPPDNHNADVYAQDMNLGDGRVDLLTAQASTNGEAVTYTGDSSPGGNGGSMGGDLANQYLARRSSSGWSQQDIAPPAHSHIDYVGFSPDLSVGILQPFNNREETPLLEEVANGKYETLYVRDNGTGSERALFTAVPESVLPFEFEAKFSGGSEDLSTMVFDATASLMPGAPAGRDIYQAKNGQLEWINILPSGTPEADAVVGSPGPAEEGAPGQGVSAELSHAVSADGSRTFWSGLKAHGLYMHQEGANTVQIDASEAGGVGGGGRFQTASNDGSKVFFTDDATAGLTSDTVPGSGVNLYEYDVDNHRLQDLSTAPEARVIGVIGASGDGSYVYFVADGVLAEGASKGECSEVYHGIATNECNLYMWHEGTTRFIGPLTETDGEGVRPMGHGGGLGNNGDWGLGLGHRMAEVSSNGNSVVFISTLSLTGYENDGLTEVYVYEAASRRLSCVSCNPSGEAPQISTEPLEGKEAAAGVLPISWTETRSTHWMSDNGDRIFFDSTVSLVPQDTNGRIDVYEWERNGTGSCQLTAGCLFLLSGGRSEDDSYLLDASGNGDDVFFDTRAQLTESDKSTFLHVYDVRVDGLRPATPLACSGTGCQGLPAASPIFATPSSVTFNGVGNFAVVAKGKTAPKSKPLTKAQKLAKALRTCRKKPKKARSRCNALARRRYAGNSNTKKSTRGRK